MIVPYIPNTCATLLLPLPNSAVVAISCATVFERTEVRWVADSLIVADFFAFLALLKKYFTFFLWIISIKVPIATKETINKTNPCIANGDINSDNPENGLLLNII